MRLTHAIPEALLVLSIAVLGFVAGIHAGRVMWDWWQS